MAQRSLEPVEIRSAFQLLFASNPLPTWVYDLETLRFLAVNAAAVAQYGYPREEFLAMRITDTLPPEDVPRLLEDLAKWRLDLQRSGEWRHRRKGGEIINVQIASHTLEFQGRKAALVVAQDITRQMRSEEAVRRHVSRLSALRAIDMAITGSLDLRVILSIFLDQVTAHLRVDAADVLLFRPDSQLLEWGAGRGFRTNPGVRATLRLGEGHAGQAVLTRHTARIPNLAEAPDAPVRQALLAGEMFVSYCAVPLIAKAQIKGVLELFHRRLLAPDQEWLDFLEALADQAAIAIDNATLFSDLQRSNINLSLSYDTTLEGWVRALDLRDRETEGHTRRVTELTLRLSFALMIPEDTLTHIRRGALLHDIGKMAVPDRILHKPGPLTPEEREIMNRHPVYAYELLAGIPYLQPALDIPYCHHEKWDGSGYPRGLRGEQIPLAARIFGVVDVWDALRSNRSYEPAWAAEDAMTYIRDQAGAHFDPRVVAVFLDLMRKEG